MIARRHAVETRERTAALVTIAAEVIGAIAPRRTGAACSTTTT